MPNEPRAGEIWALRFADCEYLYRVVGEHPTLASGQRAWWADSLLDGQRSPYGASCFVERVHPPAGEQTCVVCGRANGGRSLGGKLVLLMGCPTQRCDAPVCTFPGSGVRSCFDQHTEIAHGDEIRRERAEASNG